MATAGLRVIMVDWQGFPRDKVCGDFVSPVALGELHALKIQRLPEYKRSNVVRHAAVYLDGKHLLTSMIPQVRGLPARGRVIPRKVLDHWIVARARAAGAEIREGHRVKAYRARRHYIEVTIQSAAGMQTVRAHVLIGADGSTSTIARLVRGDDAHGDDRIIAVRGYFSGVEGPTDRADLYFTSKAFPGYCWLFPSGKNHANVGIGMVLKTVPPASDHLRTLLVRLIAEDHALQERLAGARLVGQIVGWPLTTYNGRAPVVADRVVLVGDAAGLINPLNGEGIQYALLSGRWAAEAVVVCRSHKDFSRPALETYAARIDTELGHDLNVARALVQLIRNRTLNPLWLEALQIIAARAAVDPAYAHITGGVLAGIVPTRNLLGLAVLRKTLEQVAVWLGTHMVQELSYRPKELAELGLSATHAAIDILSTLLGHRAETEQWSLSLTTSALDLLGAATRNVAWERRGPRAAPVKRPRRPHRFPPRRTP
jgi:geranylgeranyl reductase family protein